MKSRAWFPFLVLLSSLALVRTALAEEPTSPAAPPGLSEQIHRAEQARTAGRWTEAEAAYRAAWRIQRRPDIAGELGLCELELGKARDAAEHLQIALDDESLAPAERRRYTDARRKAQQQVGTLAISVNPPAAEVFIDGRSIGSRGVTFLVFVDPGVRTIRATLPGYEDAVAEIQAVRGASRPVPLVLERRPAPLPQRCPDAPDCRQGMVETLRYVGFFTAGAGAAVGASMMIAAGVIDGQVRDKAGLLPSNACSGQSDAPICKDLRAVNDTRDLLATMATTSLAITAGVGLVTVSSFWWAPSIKRPATGARIAPIASGDQLGAVLIGHW